MSQKLNDIELRRYKRQIDLPEIGTEGQEKLKTAKVLVIGAGGLGTPVLQYLAAAGVGNIGICDNDYVDESNFHRQIMYGASDLGKLKTIVAKEKLKLLNPMVEFNIHNIQIKEENAINILGNYHLVIDCTANPVSRKIIFETCKNKGIKLVTGSIFRYEGKIMVFDPSKETDSKIFQDFIQEKKEDSGIIGVVPGIIGCIQASEAIKLILNIGEPLLGKLLIFDALKMKITIK
jgi:adenylyltransferase/sulfurtransferase